jgi:hypothetical protein
MRAIIVLCNVSTSAPRTQPLADKRPTNGLPSTRPHFASQSAATPPEMAPKGPKTSVRAPKRSPALPMLQPWARKNSVAPHALSAQGRRKYTDSWIVGQYV